MTTYIAFCPLGIIATNEKGNTLSFVSFPNNAKKRADEIENCLKKTVSDSEKKIISQLKDKNDVIFEIKKEGHTHEFPNPAGDYLRTNIQEIARNNQLAKTKTEINQIYHDTITELTVRKMRVSIGKDKLLMQAINTTDELTKQINTMTMRVREWYGYYFPEIIERINDNEKLASYISETLYRTDIKGIDVEESMGANLAKEDLEEIQKYAKKIIALAEEKKELEKYIEKKSAQIAPNSTEIIGAPLVARLIAHAGTLQKLAGFPSSTIQIIGAEKALFRYLKGSGTSPKHGLIFQSTFIQRAPRQSRGKMARTLASKVSIAAKMDYYKSSDKVGAKYKQELEELLKKEIAKKPQHQQQGKPSFQHKNKEFNKNKQGFNKNNSNKNKKFGNKKFSQKRR